MTVHQPGIDGPVAVRAASTAFTVLLLGGLAAPMVASVFPAGGRYWLVVVALGAFAFAGSRIGTAAAPALHGATAAVGGYLLVLPIVVMTSGLQVGQILITVSAAGFVGALSGYLTALRKRRTPVMTSGGAR